MVGIAQLVERLVVVQEVAGSSPVTHPKVKAPVLGRGPSACLPIPESGGDRATSSPPASCVTIAPVMEMSPEDFEQLVTDELDQLPDEMVDGLDNVVFVVEDEPEDGSDLFGVYDGVAATERGQYGFGELPDRIVVFRKQHLAECDTLDELKDEVHTTLVHEIGHFHGIDDERLHELGWA
jgi:predicted Zn-dependent protease with MMP-like domain